VDKLGSLFDLAVCFLVTSTKALKDKLRPKHLMLREPYLNVPSFFMPSKP